MAELWDAGVRGSSLDVVAAWKDVLLLVALASALAARVAPGGSWADRLALAYAARRRSSTGPMPQGWLDGDATASGELLAAPPPPASRSPPTSSGACSRSRRGVAARRSPSSLSRSPSRSGARRRLPRAAPVVARLGRAGLVRRAARARLPRVSPGCPRTGSSTRATRRTRSGGSSRRSSARSRPRTCSCRASLPRRPPPRVVDGRRRRGRCTSGCSGRTRGRRSSRSRSGSSCSRSRSAGSLPAGARGRLGRRRRRVRRRRSRRSARRRATRRRSSSACARTRAADRGVERATRSPATTPRPRATGATCATAIRTVVRHPQGYGLGNAGVIASRTGRRAQGGRVDVHGDRGRHRRAGLAAFVAWLVAVLARLWRRSAWLSAAFVAVLAIGAADRRDRRALDRVHRVGRGGARARVATQSARSPRRPGAAARGAALVGVAVPSRRGRYTRWPVGAGGRSQRLPRTLAELARSTVRDAAHGQEGRPRVGLPPGPRS